MTEQDQNQNQNQNQNQSKDPGGRPSAGGGSAADEAYADLAQREAFAELKRRYTRFAFPATVAFMVWYITYVLLNNWARGFMSTPVIGNINIALVFGLLQFASTFVIAFLYSRHASAKLDPLATELREDFEHRTQS